MAVETGMNDFRTDGSSDVNTQQCPAGQVMYRGMCVSTANLDAMRAAGSSAYGAGGTLPETQTTQTQTTQTPTTQTPNQLSQIYGDIRSGIQQTTATNIEAARQTAQMQQEQLNQQLEQQRQDYLKNRQNLQRETFLRGRNVLANLANRGLATSGLQQLGDVQRTIATGQQMNELSQAFERARQGLTSQQTQIATGLQQFEAGQQSQLQNQLAGLQLQEQQAGVTEGERSVAYAESLATLLQDPNIPQDIKDTLAPLYERLITTPQAAGGTTTGTTGSLAEALGTTAMAQTPSSIAENIATQYGTDLSTLEKRNFSNYINDSENLQQDSEFMTAVGGRTGIEVQPNVITKGNKAGLNDTYQVSINGKQYNLEGREMAVLIMNGTLKVSPDVAVSIVETAAGNIASEGQVLGNRWDAFINPYLNWLLEQGHIVKTTGSRLYKKAENVTGLR